MKHRVCFSPSFPRLHSRSPLALHVMPIRASNESVTLVCSAACTRWRGHALREAQGTSKGVHTTAFLTCVVHSRNAQRSPPHSIVAKAHTPPGEAGANARWGHTLQIEEKKEG